MSSEDIFEVFCPRLLFAWEVFGPDNSCCDHYLPAGHDMIKNILILCQAVDEVLSEIGESN